MRAVLVLLLTLFLSTCPEANTCATGADGYYCNPNATNELVWCQGGVASVRTCSNGCSANNIDAWCNCDPPDCGNGHCLGHIGLCQCKPGYFGAACDKLVAAVVVPIIIGAGSVVLAALVCFIVVALFREKGEFEKDIKEESSPSPHTIHPASSNSGGPTPSYTASLPEQGNFDEDLFSKGRPGHYSELTQSHDLTEGLEDYSSSSTFVTDATLSPLHSSTEEGRIRPPPALSSSADLFKATVAGRPLFIPAQPRSHSRRRSDSDSDSDSIELDTYTPH